MDSVLLEHAALLLVVIILVGVPIFKYFVNKTEAETVTQKDLTSLELRIYQQIQKEYATREALADIKDDIKEIKEAVKELTQKV